MLRRKAIINMAACS